MYCISKHPMYNTVYNLTTARALIMLTYHHTNVGRFLFEMGDKRPYKSHMLTKIATLYLIKEKIIYMLQK